MRQTSLSVQAIINIVNSGSYSEIRCFWVKELAAALEEGEAGAEDALLKFLHSTDDNERSVVYRALKKLPAPAKATLAALSSFEGDSANSRFIQQ